MAIRVSGSAYYTRTTNLPSSTNFTVMGWFRVPTLSTWMGFFDIEGNTEHYQIGPDGSGNTFNIQSDAGGNAGSALTNGTWYHVAMTGSSSTGLNTLGYLNGALNITGASFSLTTTKLWIGNTKGSDPLNGNIAHIKIYDAVLSLAEIQAEMVCGMPQRTANLNSWFPMLSTSDDEKDFSGNARDLTVTGTPTVENGPPVAWRQNRSRTIYVPGGGSTDVTINPTGFGLVMNLGTASVAIDAIRVSPTGFSPPMSLGTPAVNTNFDYTATPSGFGLTMSLGTFDIQVDTTITGITGYNPVMSLGTPSITIGGNVTVPVTGFSPTMSLGTPTVPITSTMTPSGFNPTMSLGTPTLAFVNNLTLIPSGFSLTMAVGTPSISGTTPPSVIVTAGGGSAPIDVGIGIGL